MPTPVPVPLVPVPKPLPVEEPVVPVPASVPVEPLPLIEPVALPIGVPSDDPVDAAVPVVSLGALVLPLVNPLPLMPAPDVDEPALPLLPAVEPPPALLPPPEPPLCADATAAVRQMRLSRVYLVNCFFIMWYSLFVRQAC